MTSCKVGAEAFMSVAYGSIHQLGLFSQQYPPPLLPKPGKDNIRLQKLLKRTAKKKTSTQTSQSTTPFRSSLSPVNEASPDLEHSDHLTSPQTLDTPHRLHSIQQPPRFTVRPLYQHVASPYPQRAAFAGRAVGMSPPTVAVPSCSSSHYATKVSPNSASDQVSRVSVSTEPVGLPGEAKHSLPYSSVPEMKLPAAELKTFNDSQAGMSSVPFVGTPTSQIRSSTPHPIPTGQAMVRPLTVLTSFIKSKSPRPTFKATEPSKSPKPMFEVPQIRMYTASTSYYETSRTPPVYDTAGLTAIGTTVPQSKALAEAHQDVLTASTIKGVQTTTIRLPVSDTDQGRKTPKSELEGAISTAEIKRVTSEIQQVTPVSEIKQVPPTSEIKRVTPTSEIKRVTPTSEMMQATSTPEFKRATPILEAKRSTLASESKTTTLISQARVQTPIYDIVSSRASGGRPKTPAHHITRATTPVFEISRPNPLLFAVSPITVDPERSRSPQNISSLKSSHALLNLKTTELHETLINGDVNPDMTPANNSVKQGIKKSKSESDLTRRVTSVSTLGSQRALTPVSVPATQVVTSYQRPKTPTYEASRLLTKSPGYKRLNTSTSNIMQMASQRPKTPEWQKSKSAYRGLTPAEYAAYGGIKTYSPAFGITTSLMPTQDEVKAKEEVLKQSSQELNVKEQPTVELSETKETSESKEKPNQSDVKAGSSVTLPVIVVSKPLDSIGTISKQGQAMATGSTAAKKEAIVVQKITKAVDVFSEKQDGKTPLTTKATEIKDTPPKSCDQGSLKAVKHFLGKAKVQTDEKKIIKVDESVVKEPNTSFSPTQVNKESSKSVPPLPNLPAEEHSTKASENNKKDYKEQLSSDKLDKKGANDSPPATTSLLNVMQKTKGIKAGKTGWSRLKKHMVVEQEEPTFPELGSEKAVHEQDHSKSERIEEHLSAQDGKQATPKDTDTPKATKMWDAVLFQMFSSKENIMHQIELNKSDDKKNEEKSDEQKEIPSFAFRLPVLLFSPRFDAKKLKEAASRPVTKISVVFEMGLIGRKGKEDEPKDFNRKARGFTAT
ncbi:proteoglycan 4 isoform X1 [Cyprinodon tularosa]|uniref:proteoglycan 4 isoform X1 n=2 Tax=Cyprinodon tularosa TaxID=77115 RepID=UPI0018E2651C|nr:proteoglycan 4 isoform X1 [Cyprinodon tularosa]